MKIIPHIVNEPYLVHGNWLKVEIDPPDSEEALINYFIAHQNDILAEAKKTGFDKIDLEFPFDWGSLPQTLLSFKYAPSLNTYLLRPDHFPANPPSSPNIFSTKPDFDHLHPLLIQQADYHSRLYPEFFKKPADIDWEYCRKYTEFDLNLPNSVYLTWQIDSQIVGYILGEVRPQRTYIWELVVDQTLRGQGIGSSLLSQFLSECKKRQVNLIEVETGWNQPATRLYLKLGFIPSSQSWYLNL